MPKARKMTFAEMRETPFAVNLRSFLECSPKDGKPVTQRDLAKYIEVRPQTVSLYCTGESLPNSETLVKMAEFFDISVDQMITGKRPENKPIRQMIGLSEQTIENLKLVKQGYFEDTPDMIAIIDSILSEKDFYKAIAEAMEWQQKKESAPEDLKEACEIKAGMFLQSFLMEFFRRDHKKEYNQKGSEE